MYYTTRIRLGWTSSRSSILLDCYSFAIQEWKQDHHKILKNTTIQQIENDYRIRKQLRHVKIQIHADISVNKQIINICIHIDIYT